MPTRKKIISAKVEAGNQMRLTERITYRLARLQSRLNSQASDILKEQGGLSLVHWRILTTIDAMTATTSAEISNAVEIDKGLLSRNLKTLIEDDLVISVVEQRDHRQHKLYLTAKAKMLHDSILPVMELRQQHLLSDFSNEERNFLFLALENIEKKATRRNFKTRSDQT